MTMSIAEYRQLKKIVMMAANNSNDAEAISAFRRATDIFAKHGYTWEQALDKVVSVMDLSALEDPAEKTAGTSTGSSPPPPRRPDNGRYAGIDRDFEIAMDSASGSFLDTLEDIHSQWEDKGYLSDRQLEVVRDAAERAADRHPGGRIR